MEGMLLISFAVQAPDTTCVHHFKDTMYTPQVPHIHNQEPIN